MGKTNPRHQEDILTKNREDLQEPPLFEVLLHNDDYTTMEFVIEILIAVFNKTDQEAKKIMMNIHEKGKGIVGVYTYDIALTKTTLTESIARERQYPLKTSIEEA